MSKLRNPLALLVLLLAGFALPAQALDWSDNAFKIWWGPAFREPGVGKVGDPNSGQDIAKTTVTFTHVSGDKWGRHFLNIDMLRSDKHDPAAGSLQGATEFYAVYRRTFSLNKLTGGSTFSFPGVRDVIIQAGIDLSTKNTAFAPHKVMPIVGPALAFDVPGFWDLGLYVNKEWNNNGLDHDQGAAGFGNGGSVDFDATLTIATAWGIHLGSLPLEFEGFGSVNFPKGKDGFGNKTKTEILLQPKLVWAVGSLWGNAKAGYTLGVGYQYWSNKFGNDNGLTINGAKVNVGSLANTPFVEAGIHL
jgi:hypothetical protein